MSDPAPLRWRAVLLNNLYPKYIVQRPGHVASALACNGENIVCVLRLMAPYACGLA